VSKAYQIVGGKDSPRNRQELAKFLARQGAEFLAPMLDLFERGRQTVDQWAGELGKVGIEALLILSADQLAGPPHPGKASGEVRHYGSQGGRVQLAERQVCVDRPRLRRKGVGTGGEVALPVYQALADNPALGKRVLEIVLRGVSTRNYQQVLPELAEAAGMSRSQVSREYVAASEEALRQLAERRFDERDILILYIDGQIFGAFCVVTAVGVDIEGGKHVLGIAEGSSESAVVVKGLLSSLVERGVKPDRRRLFVIDGSKALRSAIKEVYGADSPVQRCRNHKIENVSGYLPKDQAKQASLTMRAAFRLEAKEGMAKLEQLAEWLEQTHPDAASSLREGLEEMFTINRLKLPAKLCRCLGSTNIIENAQSSVRRPTRRVTNWQDGSMVLRWAAASHLAAERNYRRIIGHEQLWILKVALEKSEQTLEANRKVG
jgi:transposase-like protein